MSGVGGDVRECRDREADVKLQARITQVETNCGLLRVRAQLLEPTTEGFFAYEVTVFALESQALSYYVGRELQVEVTPK